MSTVCAIYHIVFCTKNRMPSMPLTALEHLYRYTAHYLKEQNCTLLRIGGIENHVHMLINLNPQIALSVLMRNLKAQSSAFLSRHENFPAFDGWAKGYYAATIAYKHREHAIEYIKNQIAHHHGNTFEDELNRLADTVGLELHPLDMY